MKEPKTLLEQLNEELAEIVSTAQESLVQIEDGRRGAGAGVILHPEGLIVSNAHVVRRSNVRVTLWNGVSYAARLLARDERRDLAALSIDAVDLPTLALADGSQIRPGQWVVALGHPWGVRGAASAGMIIAVGRPVEGNPYGGDLIQVGLQLRPGHSGGPMLDARGRLVGINTMLNGPQVGLAIPVQTVKAFLKDTLSSEAREKSRPVPRPAPVRPF